MKTKLNQTLVILFVGLIGVFSVNAQYKINTLVQGQELRINQALRSENGMYNALMQSDGNFCLYKNGNEFIKCTSTNGKNVSVFKMQTDGNLVLYTAQNKPVWATDTYKNQKGAKLVLENDGRLLLYDFSGKPIYDFKQGNGNEANCVGCNK